MGGNYSYLDSRDTSPIPYYNGNQLPSRPRHTVGFSLDVLLVRWKLSYELNHIGENYLDPANQMVVPPREIHNAAAQWRPFGNGVSVAFEGRNLSDNQISDVSGFPLPGRSFFVTLGYQPKVDFKDGMQELIEWARDAEAIDKFDEAKKELESKGLA